jgi:type IV pilus assembly protein PilA
MRRINRDDDGFTLTELLVIIIIIGVLAAIAIPIFLGSRSKAHVATASSDLRNSAIAMETYFADAQTYGSVSQMVAAGVKPTVSSGTTIIIVQRTSSGYCLAALRNSPMPTSTAALKAAALGWLDSAGGLQPKGSTGCPTTTGFSPTWMTDYLAAP